MLLRHVEVRDAERTEQPLVADGRHEVGSDARDVERHRADRLAAVDDEVRAELVGARAHAVEIDEGAVGPVHVRDADDPHAVVEGAEHRVGPRLPALAVHGEDLGPAGACGRLPRVDPRRVLLGQHQHTLAGLQRQVARRDREPVARRRDQGDPFGIGAHEMRERSTQALDVGEPVVGRERPRSGPALERSLPGGPHPVELRRQGRGVEVRDLARDREGVPDRAEEASGHPRSAGLAAIMWASSR